MFCNVCYDELTKVEAACPCCEMTLSTRIRNRIVEKIRDKHFRKSAIAGAGAAQKAADDMSDVGMASNDGIGGMGSSRGPRLAFRSDMTDENQAVLEWKTSGGHIGALVGIRFGRTMYLGQVIAWTLLPADHLLLPC